MLEAHIVFSGHLYIYTWCKQKHSMLKVWYNALVSYRQKL